MFDPGPAPPPLDLDRLRALLAADWRCVGGGPGFAVGSLKTPLVDMDLRAERAGLRVSLRAGAYPASERRERLLAQLNLWNRTQPAPKAISLQDATGRGVVEAQLWLSPAPGSDAAVCAQLDAGLRAVERLFEGLWAELEELLSAPLRLPTIAAGGAQTPPHRPGPLEGQRADPPALPSPPDDGSEVSPRAQEASGVVAEAEAREVAEAAALAAARELLGVRPGWALTPAAPDAPEARQADFTAYSPTSQDSLRVQVRSGHLRVVFVEQPLPAAWTRPEAYAAVNELNRHLQATVWVPPEGEALRVVGALSVPLGEGAEGVQRLMDAIPAQTQALAAYLKGATPSAAPSEAPPSGSEAVPLLLSQAQVEAVMQEKALAIYRDSEGDLGAFIDHDRFQLRRVGAELSVIGHWHMSLREEHLDRLRRKLNALNDEYLCVTAYSTRVEGERVSVQTSVSIDHHPGVSQAQLGQQLHCAITASREVFAELLNTFTD